MSKVTRTSLEFMATGFTDVGFVTNSHSEIEWSMSNRSLVSIQFRCGDLSFRDRHYLMLR
jgi:hypothetical protein